MSWLLLSDDSRGGRVVRGGGAEEWEKDEEKSTSVGEALIGGVWGESMGVCEVNIGAEKTIQRRVFGENAFIHSH